MPRKAKALTDFSHLDDGEVQPAVQQIITQLTVNAPVFPALPTMPVPLQTLLTAFTTALGAVESPMRTANLNLARTNLFTALHNDGVYVNTVANGNAVILAQS